MLCGKGWRHGNKECTIIICLYILFLFVLMLLTEIINTIKVMRNSHESLFCSSFYVNFISLGISHTNIFCIMIFSPQ